VDEDLSFTKKSLVITHDGLVVSDNMHRLATSCNVNLLRFPFDSQECYITVFLGASNKYMALKNGRTEYLDTGEKLDRNDAWKNVKVGHADINLSN